MPINHITYPSALKNLPIELSSQDPAIKEKALRKIFLEILPFEESIGRGKTSRALLMLRNIVRGESEKFEEAVERIKNSEMPGSSYIIGCLFEHGIIYEKNLQAAQDCYKRDADKNHPLAKYALGKCHERSGDLKAAMKNYEEVYGHSADLRNKPLIHLYLPAVYALAQHYEKNNDYEKAKIFYDHAARNGHASAQYEYAKYFLPNDIVGNKINIKSALGLYRSSAHQEHPEALLKMAQLYEKGNLVKRDLIESIEHYKKLEGINGQFDVGSKIIELQIQFRKEKVEDEALLKEAHGEEKDKEHSLSNSKSAMAEMQETMEINAADENNQPSNNPQETRAQSLESNSNRKSRCNDFSFCRTS
ncbi:MAG: hypothetical protein K0R25_72 [Rickettsiaceae bacterium]|jgi:tetratricopeptide (TPR) repeat protein|nr:hypothetical protein [Rickettsiaceae bacterium]